MSSNTHLISSSVYILGMVSQLNDDNLFNSRLADIKPLVTNGFSHSYQLDESTFIFRGIRSNFHFYFIFRNFNETHVSDVRDFLKIVIYMIIIYF